VKALLNSKAVCELLGISAATLSRMVRTNRIPYVLLGTGRQKLMVRFREADLEAWVERRSRGASGRSVSNGNDMATEKSKASQVVEIKGQTPVSQTGSNT
jgi:excisionase family DNA binding protein